MSRRYCIILVCNFFLLQTATFNVLFFLMNWITDHACSKKMLKVTQSLCSLPNVVAVCDETKERINDFCIALTKKWEACSGLSLALVI